MQTPTKIQTSLIVPPTDICKKVEMRKILNLLNFKSSNKKLFHTVQWCPDRNVSGSLFHHLTSFWAMRGCVCVAVTGLNSKVPFSFSHFFPLKGQNDFVELIISVSMGQINSSNKSFWGLFAFDDVSDASKTIWAVGSI